MPTIKLTGRLPHDVDDLMATVEDIERYPEFLPSFETIHLSKVQTSSISRICRAEVTIKFGCFRVSYITRNETQSEELSITMAYVLKAIVTSAGSLAL